MSAPAKTAGVALSGLLVAGLALVLIGERVLGEGVFRQAASGGGALIVAAAIGLRIQALLGAAGEARRVEARLLLSYGGVAAALGVYALSAAGVWDSSNLDEQVRTIVPGVATVVWIAVMTVSLTALLFMELSYMRMPVARSVELRRVSTAAHAGLTLALSVIFLFSINYVAAERDVRRDVSYFKTTRPSEGSLSLVKRLDQPLQVVLFYRRANDVLGQLEPYFDTLARASGQVTVKVVDFALVPETARKHRVRENGTVLLLWGEGDEEKGRTFQVGTELTRARRALRKLDGMFQEHFRKLTIPRRSLYLTVGHGERNSKIEDVAPGDRTRDMDAILKRLNIGTKNLGIADGLASAVPEKASAVAVVGPREKFIEEEAAALLAYVRDGGRLLLMLDPDLDVGLDPLLQGLGIELLPGVMASETRHIARTRTAADHVIVHSNSYTSHPTVTTANRHRREVATVFIGGAAIARRSGKTPEPRPRVNFPLRTSADFWRDLDGDFVREQGEKKQTMNMVAAVTLGEKGKPEGRAVVVGDGDFVSDKLLRNAGNVLVFVDVLAWLIADEQIAGDTVSEEDVPIEHTRDQDKLWFYATSFAIPLPILGVGLWIARRRRRRSEAGS
jgi:hypothetical protein